MKDRQVRKIILREIRAGDFEAGYDARYNEVTVFLSALPATVRCPAGSNSVRIEPMIPGCSPCISVQNRWLRKALRRAGTAWPEPTGNPWLKANR